MNERVSSIKNTKTEGGPSEQQKGKPEPKQPWSGQVYVPYHERDDMDWGANRRLTPGPFSASF